MVSLDKIKLSSFDDLFGQEKPVDGGIIEVPLTELYDFSGHPFKVLDDADMAELTESIRLHGVMVPAIVRKRKSGGYEIISGHRRKRASELAGRKTMPVCVKEFTDDEAVWTMVDSNLQREHILPSEKAKAYKMKYDALKHQGIKADGHSLDVIGQANQESSKTIQRYIWLARLQDDLLELVDLKRITISQGVDLSFLNPEEQFWISEEMQAAKTKMTAKKSGQLKVLSQEGTLTKDQMVEILREQASVKKPFSISREKLASFFSEDATEQEMEAVILKLLKGWKENI